MRKFRQGIATLCIASNWAVAGFLAFYLTGTDSIIMAAAMLVIGVMLIERIERIAYD